MAQVLHRGATALHKARWNELQRLIQLFPEELVATTKLMGLDRMLLPILQRHARRKLQTQLTLQLMKLAGHL